MGRKILVLTGSPRKNGNTNTVVGWFAEGAKEAGADVEVIDTALLKSRNNGCIACLGCQKSDKYECVVEDDVKPVLARIPDFDVLVFATPTYFFGPSAQLKLVIDRMYSLIKFDPTEGNYVHNLGHLKWALICTGGGDIRPGVSLVDKTFKTVAGFIGSECDSLLVSNASMFSDELKQNSEIREQALAFGRKLAS
ncbi:MAG: flavodoxin family protein [Nitrospirae bacterium]|nr:flavodoxin family protein [Nitrospirota bacterium]